MKITHSGRRRPKILDEPLQKVYGEILSEVQKLPKGKYPLGLPLLVQLHLQLTHTSYQATRFICAEQPEDPKRKIEYISAVPPIARSMLDGVFNIIFVSTDPEKKTRHYYRAGWRETAEHYQQYQEQYAALPEWKEWLESLKKLADALAKDEGLSTENPKEVAYWPIPSQMIKEPGLPTPIKDFLIYLDDWFYGAYSQESHLSWPGLAIRGSIFLLDIKSDSDREKASKRRSDLLASAMLLLLMMLSEVSALFSLQHEKELQYIWTILLSYFGEAKEVYEKRYQSLLNPSAA